MAATATAATTVATAVGTRLAKIDPAHASGYQARTATLVGRLTALDEEFSKGLSSCARKTIVTSHEIREAVTDPDLNAWYDSAGYEADDKCAWHNLYQTTRGGYWVQPEYSNGSQSPYPGPGCVVPNQ